MTESNFVRELVTRYRAFYRAESKKGRISSRGAIKPVWLAGELLDKSKNVYNSEELTDAIAARLAKLMAQIHAGTAEGRWVIGNEVAERAAILEFATYFTQIFEHNFNSDRGRFLGKSRGILEDTCEFLYRRMGDQENAAKKEAQSVLQESNAS